MKGRTTFSILGIHPLLSLVRNHCISRCLALVPSTEPPDFYIIGADIGQQQDLGLTPLDVQQKEVGGSPVILLLSHDTGSLVSQSSRAFYSFVAEHVFTKRGPTLAIRPQNVYGPDISWGVIYKFICQAKKRESLVVHYPGYHLRYFLYQDDFLESLDRFLPKLLKGASYSFSIGGPYKISIHRLADSVWSAVTGEKQKAPIVKLSSKSPCTFQRNVDNDKVGAILGWKPNITVRSGLFRILSE